MLGPPANRQPGSRRRTRRSEQQHKEQPCLQASWPASCLQVLLLSNFFQFQDICEKIMNQLFLCFYYDLVHSLLTGMREVGCEALSSRRNLKTLHLLSFALLQQIFLYHPHVPKKLVPMKSAYFSAYC